MDAPLKTARPIFEFSLKEAGIEDENGIVKETIGLVKLTMDEELDAMSRANGNAIKMAYNSAVASLVEVDGRPLNRAEAENETIFRNTDQVVRQLITQAYAEISTPAEAASKVFLKSRKVKVG